MKKLRAVFLCVTLAMAALTTAYILENTCGTDAIPAVATPAESAFAAFQTDRDALRAMERAQLNDLIHSDGVSAEIRTDAQKRMMDLMDRQEKETMLEGLLQVRGFADTIVSINGDCINVLIDAPSISTEESSAIWDIICSQTDVEIGNLKIIPVV